RWGQTRQLATKWSVRSSSFPAMKAVAPRGAVGGVRACAARAAPAAGAGRQGSGPDPAGDSTSSAADIVEAAALSDDAGGRVAVALRFAATPLQSAYYAAV